MPSHRGPEPATEVLTEDDVAAQEEERYVRQVRFRRRLARAAGLVLFIVVLLVLLTLVREVGYSRDLLQAQTEQGQQAARERANLLDQVQEQNERISLLTQRLIDLGVDPATLDLPQGTTGAGPTAAAPTGGSGSTAGGSGTTGGTGGSRPTGGTGGGAATTTAPRPTTGGGGGQPAPTTAAPAPTTQAPAPTTMPPDPCLLGLPGLGCVVQLPGVGLDVGSSPLPEAVVPTAESNVTRRREQ